MAIHVTVSFDARDGYRGRQVQQGQPPRRAGPAMLGLVPVLVGWAAACPAFPGHAAGLATGTGVGWPLVLAGGVVACLAAAVLYLAASNRRLRGNLEVAGRLRAQLAESEQQFRSLAESSTAGVFILDATGLLFVNDAMTTVSGYSRGELLAMRSMEFLHPDDRPMVAERIKRRLAGEDVPAHYEVRVRRKDGTNRQVSVTAGRIEYRGRPASTGFLFDVTEQRLLERKLRDSERRHRLLADHATDVIWTMNLDGTFTYVSPSIQQLRGLTPEDAMRERLEDALAPESYAQVLTMMHGVVDDLRSGRKFPTFRGEFQQPHKDGHLVWVEITTTGMYDDDGEFIGVLGVSRDVTQRREAEERIRHMAQHDQLTGLPNRALFSDRFETAIALARRTGVQVALLFLDLDKFKDVNDTLGHAAGDLLLKAVAERINALMRGSDTVGRIGGDEFVVLLQGVAGASAAMLVAGRILDALQAPFEIDGHEVRIRASIGAAVFPDDGEDPIALSRKADIAMYYAKHGGRDRALLYDEDEMGDELPTDPG